MRTAEQIVNLFTDRQKARGDLLTRMEALRDQVNGDVIIPMPQFQDKEQESYVANLAQQGLDNYGRRIASTDPDVDCPPVDPRSVKSQQRADVRRKAVLGWWEANNMRTKRFRRARHLIGYAATAVSIRPDLDRRIPLWVPRNPLSSFPAPTVDPDDVCPRDSIFSVKMPLKEVFRRWPDQARAYAGDTNDLIDAPDRLVTILEYDDAEQISYVMCGHPENFLYHGGTHGEFLAQAPNRAGVPLSLYAGRITLDRPQGQFDGILGMWQMQAKLMALEVMAVQKGVFPDMWLTSNPNETARIVSGPHPGYTGKINELEGGTIEYKSIQPGYQTNPTIDRIERAQRLEAGISPEFGGESGTNIRTGRRGDSVLSALVDFPVQEAQLVLAQCAEEENYRATKVAKAYFGDEAKSFYVRWKGAKGHLDYTPNKDFDSDYTTVTYPMAGADVQNLTIGISQLQGTDMMSQQTGRRLHPWIQDADLEGDLVLREQMQAATMQGLLQKASTGEIPISDMARIQQLVVEDNVEPYKAILQAQQEAQERQASVTAEGAPDAADPLSPAAQPGLAVPGQGAEAGVGATMPPMTENLNRLDETMRTLRSVAPRQGVA